MPRPPRPGEEAAFATAGDLLGGLTGGVAGSVGEPDAGRWVDADVNGFAGAGDGAGVGACAAAGGAITGDFCGSTGEALAVGAADAAFAGIGVLATGLTGGEATAAAATTGAATAGGTATMAGGAAIGAPAAGAVTGLAGLILLVSIGGALGLRPPGALLPLPCCLAMARIMASKIGICQRAVPPKHQRRRLRSKPGRTTLPAMPMYSLQTHGAFEPHDSQEWLLTDGLGSFAASTVIGMNTRRYHGLLIAATHPPLGRVMTLNRIGEILTLDGRRDQPHELSVNAFFGSIHPQGYQYLRQFELDTTARWTYAVDGVTVTKELLLPRGKNVAALRYTVTGGSHDFELALLPFVSLRDFHSLRHEAGASFVTESEAARVTVRQDDLAVTLAADAGTFEQSPSWWYHHKYPIETERGQDDDEDLYTPGRFVLAGTGTQSVTLWVGLKAEKPGNWDAELKALAPVVSTTPSRDPKSSKPPSVAVSRLLRGANDFVVARTTPDGKAGTTVMAGYPWFSDWGRDTMISLPGLLLVPRRFAEAKAVLTVFAQYTSEGMIPNRFDDYTNVPEYNTVDASLWFIHAAFEYRRLSGDAATFDQILRPACQQIIDGYRRGTRYFIQVDPVDGLVRQGDVQTQLTWMDARCDGVTFTPRQGKPVEINALWYHALMLMGEMPDAQRVADSFRKAFWLGPDQGLADGVDDGRRDPAIRPNQIFAVSLPNSPLLPDQQAAVVAVVQRELLTPVGLRTLDVHNPGYRGRYTGPQFQRDGAYHNGTVWPWLIGAFLEAYLKVNGNSAAAMQQARAWLQPLVDHMADTDAIGQIAEIFEGDPPHRAVGCFAQA